LASEVLNQENPFLGKDPTMAPRYFRMSQDKVCLR
jgi:hypothetical protein